MAGTVQRFSICRKQGMPGAGAPGVGADQESRVDVLELRLRQVGSVPDVRAAVPLLYAIELGAGDGRLQVYRGSKHPASRWKGRGE